MTVADASNSPVTLLTEADFTPSIDGNPASPEDFSVLTQDEPLSVALTVGWSTSLQGFRTTIAETAGIFIDTLTPADTAAIYRFASEVDGNKQDYVAADADGKEILKDALYLDFVGDLNESNIWNSTESARVETAKETNAKRAIVLLSDGDNNTTGTNLQTLIDNAVADNINVFTLGFGSVIAPPLMLLAEETGGLYFKTPDAQGLVEIYETVIDSLTNRYQFTISLPNPAVASQLTVVVEDDQGNIGEDTRTILACP